MDRDSTNRLFIRFVSGLTGASLISMVSTTSAIAADTNSIADAEANYSRTISDRAEKILTPLGLQDSAKSNRVHRIIVQQYRGLRQTHDARDAKIKAAKQPGASKEVIATSTKGAQDEARARLDVLHTNYVTKLSAELPPEQVETVKDGMTYGVMPLTYGVYLKMYPTLTDEQKRKIKDWLIEARELAMDEGTSNEKHAVFGKYKGKINNYLSAAGYDAKQAEENLRKSGN
jgi:Spy/CpxP family protein refolding chaperone